MQGWQRPAVEDVVRVDWHGRPPGLYPTQALWLAVGVDAVGGWWFGISYYGWHRVKGGTPRVAEPARWLVEPLDESTDFTDMDFVITDDEPEMTVRGMRDRYSAELCRSREVIGGPERLTYYADGCWDGGNMELVYEPVGRPAIERAATVLLARTE